MEFSVLVDVWDVLKSHIDVHEKPDAASSLVNLLIDAGFDADEIKTWFRDDKQIMVALNEFMVNDDFPLDDEEFIDEDYDDDNEW